MWGEWEKQKSVIGGDSTQFCSAYFPMILRESIETNTGIPKTVLKRHAIRFGEGVVHMSIFFFWGIAIENSFPHKKERYKGKCR